MQVECVKREPEILALCGSFDPPHLGHLSVALAGLTVAPEVIMIPAFKHMEKSNLNDYTKRIEMLKIMVEESSLSHGGAILVSDIDGRNGGSKNTNQILGWLCRETKKKVGLLIGSDLVPGFERWDESENILNCFGVWIVERPYSPLSEMGLMKGMQVISCVLAEGYSGKAKDLAQRGDQSGLVRVVGNAVAQYIIRNREYEWPKAL